MEFSAGGHGGGIDSSNFNPPLARAVKPTHFPPQPTQDTPHSSLRALCLIYSWLTCSQGSTPPFWWTDISSYGLCNFKRWKNCIDRRIMDKIFTVKCNLHIYVYTYVHMKGGRCSMLWYLTMDKKCPLYDLTYLACFPTAGRRCGDVG